MLKKLTPLLIVLFTSAFIMSCGGSSDPLVSEAESNIKDGNYEAALTASQKYIKQNPQNPLGYYYKGVALGQKGEAVENPSEATSLYKEMDQAFQKAEELASKMEERPAEMERIGPVRTSVWRTEHNAAIPYAKGDSVAQTVENPIDVALAHLNNATIVQPDSALSWGVIAQLQGQEGNFKEAIDAQERFIEITDDPDATAYLLLAQFYRNSEQPKEAIEVLEKVREKFPDNIQAVEILADSYSQAGEREKAIATVEELVDENPDEPRYRLSLGTQIYQSALEIQSEYDKNVDELFNLQQKLRNASGQQAEQIKENMNKISAKNEKLMQEINDLTNRAVEELKRVTDNQPKSPDAYNTLGVIYQNKAAVLFDQRNLTTDNEKAAELDKRAKEDLKNAMKYYEQAAEIDPDNPTYWRSLFQIYTALGMDEKAKEAEKKAGMQ